MTVVTGVAAKSIMIQGTTSSAGKSFLVAGLCRVFSRRGLKVAPFKSQNMALNSFVTADGLEMGRAQVMQAAAAGVEPDVRMNPILLKPTGHTGSQVVVMGEVAGQMSARDYFAYRASLKPTIKAAYDELATLNDLVVIEGAGSPAEINLKRDDIVNMGLAQLVRSPVLIVGDIDRGGVFASLYGTVALLTPEERPFVRGLVINRFRGDPTLLGDGPAQLAGLTGVPVLGCIPFIDIDIDDEDSLADHLTASTPQVLGASETVDVAIVRLPHISNWTDFDPLRRYPQLRVRFVEKPLDLGSPDLLVLPGTKATLADLRWLHGTGWGDAIVRAAASGAIVMGICGGYQMLGRTVADPVGAEGGGTESGLALLPVLTTFVSEKRRTRIRGAVTTAEQLPQGIRALGGSTFSGYEIHMGRTTPVGTSSDLPRRDDDRMATMPLASLNEGDGPSIPDGCATDTTFGCYVHGIFDDGSFADALVRMLCSRRGIAPILPPETFRAYRERQYDLLADTVEEHLDMEAVSRIIEQGV